ncbi:MAG: hypothetical protein CMH13_04715 [Martelella sp.]|uniref:hypothetical protein n=1 Tax=Martelella sp. TaxID=1969699 RepID=UPI000C3DD545|nr:hypothetical protein [Martelella sp.]MAU19814.1 hypothetical protein [Martelella sp.]|tara:strand:- start:268 stop:663 length:396 start_codon:yes stop_codon:yes gene_type:complete
MNDFSIRKARPEDRSAIIDICIRTADRGDDGRHLFSQLDYPALLWALPYFTLEPDHALVLTKGRKVLGYAVGTSDTASFASKLEHCLSDLRYCCDAAAGRWLARSCCNSRPSEHWVEYPLSSRSLLHRATA